MGDLITRVGKSLFDGARPIDRTVLIVDALVLLLVLTELIRELLKDRTSRKREKLIGVRVQAVRHALSKGALLHSKAVPSGDTRTDAWYQSVIRWTKETAALLESYSAHAATSFIDVSDAQPMKDYQAYACAQEYANLLARLKTLRTIIEDSGVYL